MGPERSIAGMGRSYGLHRHYRFSDDVPPVKVTRGLLKRVLGYFTPYWPQWIAILLCIAATSGLGVVPPLLVRGILDDAIPERRHAAVALLVGGIVGPDDRLRAHRTVLQNWLSTKVGQGIMHDLREALYRHLQEQSLGFYTTERAGEIVSRVNNDVGAVQRSPAVRSWTSSATPSRSSPP
jgi:ATP-binding cassette subfamily B protein